MFDYSLALYFYQEINFAIVLSLRLNFGTWRRPVKTHKYVVVQALVVVQRNIIFIIIVLEINNYVQLLIIRVSSLLVYASINFYVVNIQFLCKSYEKCLKLNTKELHTLLSLFHIFIYYALYCNILLMIALTNLVVVKQQEYFVYSYLLHYFEAHTFDCDESFPQILDYFQMWQHD